MTKIHPILLSILLLAIFNANANEPGTPLSEKKQAKSLMIIFYPPLGREEEFLDAFVKKQSQYLENYKSTSQNSQKVESINIAPTKLGEPLIHLMIYRDLETYGKARNIFTSREHLLSYIMGHASLYGGEKIDPDFLKNSKVHFGEVIGELDRQKNR